VFHSRKDEVLNQILKSCIIVLKVEATVSFSRKTLSYEVTSTSVHLMAPFLLIGFKAVYSNETSKGKGEVVPVLN